MQSLQTNSQPKLVLPPVTFSSPATLPPGPRHGHELQVCSAAGTPVGAVRLDSIWEHRAVPTAGIWEVWNAAETDLWSSSSGPLKVPGWYRARIAVRNPIAQGRTILHFQASAQATTLWVGPILIGTRTAAEPCVFDITDAVARLAPSAVRQGVPVAVRFGGQEAGKISSRPIQDSFTVISGFTGSPTLVYLPALALDHVSLRSRLAHDGATRLSVSASLYNPTDRTSARTSAHSSACTASIEIIDPTGNLLHSRTQTVDIWNGPRELASLRIVSGIPARCRITLTTPEGQTRLEQPIPSPAPQPRHTLRAPSSHTANAHVPYDTVLTCA